MAFKPVKFVKELVNKDKDCKVYKVYAVYKESSRMLVGYLHEWKNACPMWTPCEGINGEKANVSFGWS